MDRAKMEEVAQMLWMILIVVVFLDTREKIAVLVSNSPCYKIVTSLLAFRSIIFICWLYIVVSLHYFLEIKSEQTFKAKAKRGSC